MTTAIPLLDEAARRRHDAENFLHSVLLIAGIGALLGLATWLLYGPIGVLVIAAVLALTFALGPKVDPQRLMRLINAQPVTPAQGGPLLGLVSNLAARAELPRPPALYVLPSATLNAFATGTRDNAAIAVTEGLLRKLTMREIAAVLAHEISHVRNNDLWVMGLADQMTRVVQVFWYAGLGLAILNVIGWASGDRVVSWGAILLLYLAPALSSLLQFALSRTREYDADLEAAMLTGDPIGLAQALRRLEHYTGRFWEDFTPPVPARRIPVPSILRTHPATEDRVKRLLALGSQPPGLPPLSIPDAPMVSLAGWGPVEMRPRYRWPGMWL